MSLEDVHQELKVLQEMVKIDNVSQELDAAHDMILEQQKEVSRLESQLESFRRKVGRLEAMKLDDLLSTHASLEETLGSLRRRLPKYLEETSTKLLLLGIAVFATCLMSNWVLVLWWTSDLRANERHKAQVQVEATLKKESWALRNSAILNPLGAGSTKEMMFLEELSSCVQERQRQGKEPEKVNCLKKARKRANVRFKASQDKTPNKSSKPKKEQGRRK